MTIDLRCGIAMQRATAMLDAMQRVRRRAHGRAHDSMYAAAQ